LRWCLTFSFFAATASGRPWVTFNSLSICRTKLRVVFAHAPSS
jgi:hypothetical protein